MSWASPQWLLLCLPLGLAWWWCRPGGGWLRALRIALLGLIVLAMAEPRLWLPDRAGTVVVLADRSDSMPADAAARQLEAIDLLHRGMSPDERLAVVSFGAGAAVEQPAAVGGIQRFEQGVGGGASDLAAGLRRAVSLVPDGAAGRVLLLSDGRYTGPSPQVEAVRAAGRGIAVDYRELSRSLSRDVAVLDVDAPGSVSPGESFMISGWVYSPTAQRVSYELRRGSTVIAAGERDLGVGRSRLSFRDTAAPVVEAGAGDAATEGGGRGPRALDAALEYELDLRVLEVGAGGSAGVDPWPENNRAGFIVGVSQARPLLVISQSPGRGLASLLAAGGLEVVAREPSEVTGGLTELSGYSGVVLENVAATDLPSGTLEQLAALVDAAGVGLLMTGGQRSFGPGGYYQSPIDAVLPVSMELRQEHRKLSLAIAIALDRSGSMAMTVPGGRTKMDLANLGAAQVLDLLGPMDEIGVLAVDSAPHTILELTPAVDKAGMRQRILGIDSMGGGIYVYPALASASQMLARATPTTRHVILFADAQDSEEPGQYQELLEKARRANITVSVIGLGQPTDVDAPLLRDIAQRGGGRSFFTDDPAKLPQLFAQDTFVVARSSFIEELTDVGVTGGLAALTGRAFPEAPAVGGYNLNYLRPGASLAMASRDEYTAPLVASWNAGLGRVAVYSGEVDGKFTGPIAGWPRFGDLLTSLSRWVAADDQRLPPDLHARQQVRDGQLVVDLFLPPDDPGRLPTHPKLAVLLSDPEDSTAPPTVVRPRLRYTATDQLSATWPLRGRQVAVASLDLGPLGRTTLPPARLLYSPEYRPRHDRFAADAPPSGSATLVELARLTGGQARADLASMWQDLAPRPRAVAVAPWLWLAAVTVLLLEILERRTALLSHLTARPARGSSDATTIDEAPPASVSPKLRVLKKIRRRKKDTGQKRSEAHPAGHSRAADAAGLPSTRSAGQETSPAPTEQSPTAPSKSDGADALLGALQKAKRQSDGRNRR